MKSRIIGTALAVVLAAIGTFVLISYVRGAENRALAGERTVAVLVLEESISRGAEPAELEGKVRSTQVPAKVQAEGAVASLDELDGKVAAVDLVAGEQVVASRFIAPETLAQTGDIKVPEGLQRVTVTLEPERAVGGHLTAGNLVGVVVTEDRAGERADGLATGMILQKVLVTAVQATAPVETAGTDALTPAAPTANTLVTLAVDSAQAEKIIHGAEAGTLWLTAQDEATVESGTAIQTRETILK